MNVFDLEHIIDDELHVLVQKLDPKLQERVYKSEHQWLKEGVYRFICRNHNGAKNCLTKHLLTDFRIHLNLNSKSVSIDENTFRSILGDLKSEGRIGHIGSNVDTWVPISPTTSDTN